jgi:hypothetical protein
MMPMPINNLEARATAYKNMGEFLNAKLPAVSPTGKAPCLRHPDIEGCSTQSLKAWQCGLRIWVAGAVCIPFSKRAGMSRMPERELGLGRCVAMVQHFRV